MMDQIDKEQVFDLLMTIHGKTWVLFPSYEIHVWSGNCGVNVYDLAGNEIEYYQFAKSPKDEQDAIEQICTKVDGEHEPYNELEI